jgi:hypothetical protein
MDAALPWPWPSTRNANNRSKVRVGTTSRSMAAIACAWLRKNVFQPCDGDPPRTMYFETVDWATSKPSINSSRWIRDAPHFGFSLLIRRACEPIAFEVQEVMRFECHANATTARLNGEVLDSATRPKEEKMKMLPQVLFWLGLISVPFAWLVWYFGPEIEIIRPVLANINDPALRAALQVIRPH